LTKGEHYTTSPETSQRLGGVSTRHSLELWYNGFVNAKATTLLSVILLAIAVSANGETGFDPKYERDYNIFNPVNKYAPDNPLNPANQYNTQTPFEPLH